MAEEQGPFNTPHLYLQWGGTLPGGDEWSCGLRMIPINQGVATSNQARLDAAANAVHIFHGTVNSQISPRAVLTFAKLNAIGVNGRYVEQTTLEHIFPNEGGVGNEAKTPPNQVALVVSLTTAVSRGPAHRGRFYMPLPCLTPGIDGRITIADRNNVHDSAVDFLAALNAVDPNLKVAVMSRKLYAPASRLVTGIEVGRVLDTQRRRRNKLAEAY